MTRILRIASALILFLLLSTLTACTRPDSGSVIPAAQRQQVFQLQGRIQQGPSAGLNLSGELRTTIDAASHLKGVLTPESGAAISVTGQIAGQAIHLSFDLGNNNAILGVGTLQHSIDNPQGSAGGMLTGPQPGDSGAWFARWTTITIPITPAPTRPVQTPARDDVSTSPPSIFILTLMILVATLLIGVLLKQKGAGQSIYSRTRGRSTLPSVKASAQIMEPERWPDETALPLAQFATTYAHGDDHYDLSFTIESARREFLGECGVGISATTTGRKRKPDSAAQSETSEKMPSADDALTFLAKLARDKEDQLRTQAQQEAETRMDEIMGHKSKAEAAPEIPAWLSSTGTTPDKGKPVTALEVWIFDKNDINTVTKVLRSTHGFYEPAARSSRDPVNDVLVIEPDQMVVLETKTLRLRVKVLAVEYASDLAYSSGVFKQVNLKLAVWSK